VISLSALDGIPEIKPGDDLAALIAAALAAAGIGLEAKDVLVVTQKVVSKAEGRVVELSSLTPRAEAKEWAARWGKDPRQVELVLQESAEVLRMAPGGLIISRTRHGFVCANAGVDLSNVGGGDVATLLPVDPDASARALRERLGGVEGIPPAIVVSDSFGRPWRQGTTDVAIGVAGLAPLLDYRGQTDPAGYELRSTVIAVADEIASAAELVKGKTAGVPVAIVRGLAPAGNGSARELVLPAERDLFR
jgi:coenzyme F420-0:L-glutamate ligase/coenzyme F420-1:gamma-L-glutamate ligase